MLNRPTRLRRNNTIRQMVKETSISMEQIVYPVFLVEGECIKKEISSLKNQYHYSVDMLINELDEFKKHNIKSLLLFASVNEKSINGISGANEDGIIQTAIRKIKQLDPSFYLIADVCLCQYKLDGHCCIFGENKEIDRQSTLEVLSEIALSYGKAGVDMVAPSDMMDGRIGAIRQKLDENDLEYVAIMAYSAKYASSFYGPFREAAHSSPTFGDRKTYQMDFSNRMEAVKEIELDIEEGADIVMVKPAMAYLDIISDAKKNTNVPIAAYQVSGEYAMLVNAIENKILDERAIFESLIAIKRSGAQIIITYFAKDLSNIIEREAKK